MDVPGPEYRTGKLRRREYFVDTPNLVDGVTENLRVLLVRKSIVKSSAKIKQRKSQNGKKFERGGDRSCLSVS